MGKNEEAQVESSKEAESGNLQLSQSALINESESEKSQQPHHSQQTLTQQLQHELSKKHMLFQKHHIDLGKIVGQGIYYENNRKNLILHYTM